MTTITHGLDGQTRFDGMSIEQLIEHLRPHKHPPIKIPAVYAIIDALHHLRHISEWQPIETAPRDGTEVDLWKGKHRLPNCHFHCGEWLWWNTTIVDDEPSWLKVKDPTHWRPLQPGPMEATP